MSSRKSSTSQKGSIPARLDVKLDAFDACAKTSARDFFAAGKNSGLVPSAAHGMAMPPAIEEAVKDVVSRYWNDERFTTDMALRALLDASRVRK